MKKLHFITFILLVLSFSACKKDNEPTNPFGINYSDYQNTDKANGFIIYQNYGGPRIDLAVDTAYLLELDDINLYQMCYFFTGSDSLKVTIQKYTPDFNYHSNADAGQNLIKLSVFNIDTIKMDASALSIQPRNESNDFHTVLNLHASNNLGTFNGTVDSVVLVK